MPSRGAPASGSASLAALIVHRIAGAVPVLFGMASAVFFISRVLPGDPAALYLAPDLPPSVAAAARHALALDRSLFYQYALWLRQVATLDLGWSLVAQQKVVLLIAATLPNTLLLGGTAFLMEITFGSAAALLAARRPGSLLDRLVGAGSMVLYATPGFFLGTVLLIVCSYRFGWLPAAQMHSVDAASFGPFGSTMDLFRHLLLPALTSSLPGAAGIARYLRSSLRQTLDEPFILAARGHGIPERTILLRYALPNASMPLISIGGMEIGTLLTGTLVTETLFAWPGMGRLTVAAVLGRDYPLLIGCALVAGTIVILANLLADVLHAALDPRVRMQ